MARKVFIAVLGTGFYGICKYTKGKFSSETRFIQKATLEYINVKEKWTDKDADGNPVDRIIILLTEGARTTNWNKEIRTRKRDEIEEEYIGLEKELEDMQLPCPVETISIPDGKDEDEMWEIFNSVFQTIKPNDEIYFDLTHGFRYLPMLVLVLGNYAKFLKEVTVKHISYGNYEARNKETNEAPLMDILPLSILQDWTFAAADLIRNGNIERLNDLKNENALTPLLRSKRTKNIKRRTAEEPLKNYIESLDKMLQDMKLCLAPNIIKNETINNIHSYYENVIEAFEGIIAPVPPIIHKIQNSLVGFEKTDSRDPNSIYNGYEAAKWCYDHQLYQQAITILDENITTHFCYKLGTNKHIYAHRKATNAYLCHKGYEDEDWKDEKLKEIRKKIPPIPDSKVRDFVDTFGDTAGWLHIKRNTYNHASMLSGKGNQLTEGDIKKLGEEINYITSNVREFI